MACYSEGQTQRTEHSPTSCLPRCCCQRWSPSSIYGFGAAAAAAEAAGYCLAATVAHLTALPDLYTRCCGITAAVESRPSWPLVTARRLACSGWPISRLRTSPLSAGSGRLHAPCLRSSSSFRRG
jgi:hypothetical protein